MYNLNDLHFDSYLKSFMEFKIKVSKNVKFKIREGAPKMNKNDKITIKPFEGFINTWRKLNVKKEGNH